MKKIISLLLILSMLTVCGCKRQDLENAAAQNEQEEIMVVDPAENDMSHLEVVYPIIGEYASPSDLSMMEKWSDCIVVATAIDSYKQAEYVYITKNGEKTDNIEEADSANSYVKRVFKVDKVLKGEPTDEIVVREEWFAEGERIITVFGEYIVNKGDKYLLFLYHPISTPNEYYPFHANGKINLNGTQTEQLDKDMLKEIKESPTYKEFFE